jgi:hypothetical protein
MIGGQGRLFGRAVTSFIDSFLNLALRDGAEGRSDPGLDAQFASVTRPMRLDRGPFQAAATEALALPRSGREDLKSVLMDRPNVSSRPEHDPGPIDCPCARRKLVLAAALSGLN